MTRRIYSILFLLALAAPTVGLYGWLQWQRHAAKGAAQIRIAEGLLEDEKGEEFVYLAFDRATAEQELEWEFYREFEYQGEMYDIVEREIREDSVFFVCYWDRKETEINDQLAELSLQFTPGAPSSEDNPQSRDHWPDFMKHFCPHGQNKFTVAPKATGHYAQGHIAGLTTWSGPPPTPPPWLRHS